MRNTAAENVENFGRLALKYETRSLNIKKKLLPENHLDIGHSLDNLEKIYEYRQEWALAVKCGLKLIRLYQQIFDPYHPLLASAYNNTAIVLREDKQKEKSIEFSKISMEIVKRSLGESHIEMAYANWTLSNNYQKFDEPQQALECMNKTVSILKKLIAKDHPNMVLARNVQAELRSMI